MRNNIAEKLAEIHSEFGIYDSDTFNVRDSSMNIIDRISNIKELDYLHRFYLDYKTAFITKWNKQSDQHPISRATNVSRSVDLPFIGESVIQTRRAKYIFVFEGSLSPPDRLSVTVLSCLWPLEGLIDQEPHQGIFRTFWQSPYDYIVECLGINVEIAKHSYVVDAVRIGKQDGRQQDRKKNRKLLKQEIDLLDPELVVLVGRTAAVTLGKEAQEEQGRCYVEVPFPTKRRSKQDVKKADSDFKKLRNRWSPNKSFGPKSRTRPIKRR